MASKRDSVGSGLKGVFGRNSHTVVGEPEAPKRASGAKEYLDCAVSEDVDRWIHREVARSIMEDDVSTNASAIVTKALTKLKANPARADKLPAAKKQTRLKRAYYVPVELKRWVAGEKLRRREEGMGAARSCVGAIIEDAIRLIK